MYCSQSLNSSSKSIFDSVANGSLLRTHQKELMRNTVDADYRKIPTARDLGIILD
jgi:hypothetical protein